MDLRGDQEVPPLAKEILAIEGFLEGETCFSLWVWPWAGRPGSSKCLNTQEDMGNGNWINELKQKTKKERKVFNNE